jgi:hypothetical protein
MSQRNKNGRRVMLEARLKGKRRLDDVIKEESVSRERVGGEEPRCSLRPTRPCRFIQAISMSNPVMLSNMPFGHEMKIEKSFFTDY